MITKKFGETLFDLLQKLEDTKLFFQLRQSRDDFLMITVVIPGEIWEIEISQDGHIEIEKFKSDGEIFDEKALVELFEDDSD